MSSWFSDLAGRAENILNKIDQNAANVLKTDSALDQLIEVKITADETNQIETVSPLKRPSSSNSLKLTRTPMKLNQITLPKNANETSDIESKMTTSLTSSNADDLSPSGWNQSRRSSSSSRTETVQTVIEYPIRKQLTVQQNGNDSTENGGQIEFAATKIVLAQVKSERDQLQNEVTELKKQITNNRSAEIVSELEEMCNGLTNENEKLTQRLQELENGQNISNKKISELESSIVRMRENELQLNEKLSMAKLECDRVANELQQHRSRAQQILLAKEELILKLKGTRDHDDVDGDIDGNVHKFELDEMRKERDLFADEVKSLRMQCESDRQLIQSMDERQKENETRFVEAKQNLKNQLKQGKIRITQLEDAISTQTKEMKAMRDEMKRQQLNYSTKMHDKDNEIAKLRLRNSNQSTLSAPATDDRIYSLTQSLVQKQNSLESITAERNALRIQLEKRDQEHRETMQVMRHQRLHITNINVTDDAKSLVPNFMQENPFDTRVARRMKRAYSSVDAAGVRIGVFLRRYPLIRILVIVYVAILHLWVMFVLLSSTPNQ